MFISSPQPQADLVPQEPEPTWIEQLRASYTSVDELARAGLLTAPEATALTGLGERFKVRVTPYYAALMEARPSCPIRQQAIPALGEEDPVLSGWAMDWSRRIYDRAAPWHADAIGDLKRLAAPRLTHRYGNRALLHFSSTCAVYCRFCFRKGHLNDRAEDLYGGSLDAAFAYLGQAREVRELILTGGDPLSVSDAILERFLARVQESLPHVRTVRFHTRMPVTLPSRLTTELARVLNRSWTFRIALVSHFNHPRELTPEARAALTRIAGNRVSLYNQNVLLRGINDSAECLAELYQALYESGVTPFYLHHPDWTPGTFQFRTGIEQGRAIYGALRGLISGPALPQYVLDIPQGYGKIPLMDGQVRLTEAWEDRTSAMRGAIYELNEPSTRANGAPAEGASRTLQYLDLYSAET